MIRKSDIPFYAFSFGFSVCLWALSGLIMCSTSSCGGNGANRPENKQHVELDDSSIKIDLVRPFPNEEWTAIEVVGATEIVVERQGVKQNVVLLRVCEFENSPAKATAAIDSLKRLVLGKSVVVDYRDPEVKRVDDRGRLPAYVYLAPLLEERAILVNVEMVRRGLLKIDMSKGEGKYAKVFRDAELESRAGSFAGCNR
ncbi:hypothetical protein PLCT2_01478 [Planctomycetaceae bacterium]|nr:hypothetical protein PLCT2_01478 [Planctomycetaceae bacterium]